MLDLRFWQKINANVVARYRKAIFDPAGGGSGAKDVFGKPYPAYKSSYSVAKRTGKIKRQDEKFKGSTAPVLTGDLYKDFQLRKTGSSGFSFGTVAWGSTTKFLERNKRFIATEKKALPDKVATYIMDQADKYVKKELGKIKGRTFNI